MDYQGEDLAGQPAVTVIANGCSGEITVNIRYVFETRAHDTNRTFAAALQTAEEGRGPWPQLTK